MEVIEQSDFKITIVLENKYDLEEMVRVMKACGCFTTQSSNVYDNLSERLKRMDDEIERRRRYTGYGGGAV